MKHIRKRTVALLLALTLLLTLAACVDDQGGNGDNRGPDEPAELVYVPQFRPAETGRYISGACAVGDAVYLMATVEQFSTETDPETGETSYLFQNGCALFRGTSAGQFEPWEHYRSLELLEEPVTYAFSDGMWPGEDGTLWVSTYASATAGQTAFLQQFAQDGTELARIDLSTLPDVQMRGIRSAIVDPEGRLYLCTSDQILVFDGELAPLFTLKTGGPVDWNDRLILLTDGRVGLRSTQGLTPESQTGGTLLTIDCEKEDWGTSYTLPYRTGKVRPGSGGYLFFCEAGNALYGYVTEKGEMKKLLSWTDVNVNAESVLSVSALDGHRLLAVTGEVGTPELVVLTATDPATLPETVTLTYGTMELQREARADIIAFNKKHPDCFIKVLDYSEYNTASDQSQGLNKLSTELLAGKIDILDTAGIPVRQYGNSGILEDLLPYLESDPDIGRDRLVTQVLDAALQDGKLYQAFDSFSILTAAGHPSKVGDGMGWTMEELTAAMETMPEDAVIFGAGETGESLLEKLVPMEMDAFVDWEAGTCRFDSEEFKALLEFCHTLPATHEEEDSEYDLAMEGRQLLLCDELTGLGWQFLVYPTAFGGECSFVGYPSRDGSCGSCFRLGGGTAMVSSGKHKDQAWAFLRESFLPQYQTGSYFGSAFPVNASDFDRMVEVAMTPQYQYDEHGDICVDESGQPMEAVGYILLGNSLAVSNRAIREAEYEQFMELLNAIDRVYDYDEHIWKIVRMEAAVFFAGDRSLDETAAIIQNKVNLYVNEKR